MPDPKRDLKRDLKTMLHESDSFLLPLFAQAWGVSTAKLTGDKLIDALAKAMLDPVRAEKIYNSLDDKQRAALKVLNGDKNRMMSAPMFEMIYQAIRPLGNREVEREKPHENPTGPAEALYYRGFIGKANDKVGKGIGPVFYIPEDLAQALPLNRTGYDAAALESYEDEDEELDALGDDHEEDEHDASEFAPPATRTPRAYEAPPEPSVIPARPSTPTSPAPKSRTAVKTEPESPESASTRSSSARTPAVQPTDAQPARRAPADEPRSSDIEIQPVEHVEGIQHADTSIVDDLITLLALLKLESPEIEATYRLRDEALEQRLLSHMLVDDISRLQFMIGVGISTHLIEVQSGRMYPHSTELAHWLRGKRSAQLKALVDAWLDSESFYEVWHTPGLYAETGWSYDAADARRAVMTLLHGNALRQDWWRIDDFIDLVKITNPNFQRPGGDYDSWYIKGNDDKYLKGLNSWDAVEGAVLSFYLTGPMHWLGLMDTAEDAAGDAVRFSAYGRAFIDQSVWPSPVENEEHITIQPDGSLVVSRRASRVDRYQLARFTTWKRPATLAGDPYVYQLDADGIRQADRQGISVSQIGSFVNRLLDGGPVPAAVASLLENWRTGPAASATMEQLRVLRTTSTEVMDSIYKEPALRRYLGARLGDMAVIVRDDQWEALRDALGALGIDVSASF